MRELANKFLNRSRHRSPHSTKEELTPPTMRITKHDLITQTEFIIKRLLPPGASQNFDYLSFRQEFGERLTDYIKSNVVTLTNQKMVSDELLMQVNDPKSLISRAIESAVREERERCAELVRKKPCYDGGYAENTYYEHDKLADAITQSEKTP